MSVYFPPLFIKISQHLAVHLLIAFTIIVILCSHCLTQWDAFIRNFLYSFLLSFLLGEGNGYLINKIDNQISWIDAPAKRLFVGLLILLGYSLLISLVVVGVYHVFILKSLSLSNFNWPYFIKAISVPVYIAVFITTIGTSYSFLRAWKQSTIDAERLKRENLQAQYDSLKSQVNPHFLFNSFNVLSDLVYVNQDLAVQFIQQLSQVFRYVLESSKKETVPLQTELQFLKSYIFLLNIRFGQNLRVAISGMTDTGREIIPLCLQMLIENAIKHNVVSSEEPLTVEVEVNKDKIKVVNSLQRKNNVESSMGLGLENINSRYYHLSGLKIKVEETTNHFIVEIPLIGD